MSDQDLNLGHLAEEFAKLLVDVPQVTEANAPINLEEGERREVTCVFLDLVGYTRLAERLDPEQLKFVVSNTLQVFTNQVKKFGGTVEKFIGDAIMALFGRAQAHEDDSRRAVAAARAILDRLEDINSILAQRGIRLHARIGINRGLIVTGTLAEHDTVTGEALNIAQRLEANAPEDGILISESVHKDCQAHYRCEELPPLHVKNKTEALKVYRIWEELSQSTVSRIGAGPFVGREGELSTMQTVWERTCSGNLSIIQITGEAGIGKSRLVQEFVAHVAAQRTPPPAVVYLSADSFGQAPYHVLSDLVREYLEQAKKDLGTFLTEIADDSLRGGVQEYQVYLRDLLGLPLGADERAALEVMEPRARQAEMLLALKRFITSMLQQEEERGVPALVAVIDNQQWVSHASRDALGQILQTLPNTLPLLWIFVGRPLEVGQWLPATLSVTTLNLTNLTTEAVEELVRLRLPKQEISIALCRQVVERTGGNPFFLNEALTALARLGEVTQFALEELLPGSIKALVLSRLDRLPKPEKFALQLAAVAGREFSLPLLGHVLERVRYGFDANTLIQELIEAEFLSPAEGTFSIAQPMVAEVAYTTILHANRRKLHTLVAQWVEECHRDNPRAYAPFLAEQWARAGEAEKAIVNYLEAGFAARSGYAYRDGVVFFERALQLLKPAVAPATKANVSAGGLKGSSDDSEQTVVEGADGLQVERLGLVYVALSHFYEALSNVEGRARLIREGIVALPPSQWSVAALRWQSLYLQFEKGDRGTSEKLLRVMQADPATQRFPDILIECNILLGAVAWERGEDASVYIDAALALRARIEERIQRVDATKPLSRYYAALDQGIIYKIDYNVFNHYKNINDLVRAEDYFYRVLEATGAKHTFAQHMVDLFYCSLMWDRGVEFATMAMRAALARAYFREIGWTRGVGWGGFYRGAALWRMGRFAEAHQITTETLQYLERANDTFLTSKLELLLAAIYLGRGDAVGYQLRKGRMIAQTAELDEGARLAIKREFAVFEGQCVSEQHALATVYEVLMQTATAPLSKVEVDEFSVTVALVAAQLGHAAEAVRTLAEVRSSIERNKKMWLTGLMARAEGIVAASQRDVEAMHRAFGTSIVRLQEIGAQFECHLSYRHWWSALEQLGIATGAKANEVKQGLHKWRPAVHA